MKPASSESRIRGLDALRLVAALWVVFSHFGFLPLTAGVDKNHLAGLVFRGVYGNLFAGPAAVMVFFMISGFCIHFPYCRRPFKAAPFFARRYVRILIPMLAAMGIAEVMGLNLSILHASILWSLVAELIYYTLYPLLRQFGRVVGWRWTLGLAFGLACAALSIEPDALDYDAFGNSLSWLLGLPVWLLGCCLAEHAAAGTDRAPTRRQIWAWRLLIWGLASLASVLRFHSPLGYPATLLPFSVPVYFWLRREIAYFRTVEPWRLLEWAGQWSYSIYLTHTLSRALVVRSLHLPTETIPGWLLLVGLVLVLAYLFYLLVEWPSHQLARWLAGKVSPPAPLNPSA